MDKKQSGSSPSNLEIDLKQVIYALSDSLDFVGIDEIHHGKRVGLMVMETGKTMGWSEDEAVFALELGLLHDCGVSSTRVHNHLVREFNWSNAQVHCNAGYKLLNNIEVFSHMSLPVKYHHTWWNKLKDTPLDQKTRESANLIFLADRVDVLSAPFYRKDILSKKNSIREEINRFSGKYFAPHINEAFWETASKQSFWLSLSPEHILHCILNLKDYSYKKRISLNILLDIAKMFGKIVDAKSTFTMEHSMGVSRLSRLLAEKLKLGSEVESKIEIAGLLHDIGKLKIPDEILEKKGPLTKEEKGIIQEHSFETYEILSSITGIEDIARWAAYHHERPDGKGYPFQIMGKKLETEARIIAASDIFQALVQKRPYRSALSIKEALKIIRAMAKEGSLDPNIVELVDDNSAECFMAATCTV